MSVVDVVPLGSLPPSRYARLARGLRLHEVEGLAGIPAGTLWHFETGRRRPSPERAWRIAAVLDVDAGLIFPEDGIK